MKCSERLLCFLAALAATCASAQQPFPMKIKGTCQTTDASGQVLATPLNNQSLIQQCVGGTQFSNAPLSLIYVLNADSNGDMIQVVDTNSASVYCQTFRLYVPTVNDVFDGQFVFVENRMRTQVKRIYYLFGEQSTHNVGTVLVDKKFFKDSAGNTNRISITGEFRYFRLPEGEANLKICSGTFTVNQKLKP